MDPELRALEARIGERFEKVETEGRHTRTLVEEMSSGLQLLAEGVIEVSERLESYRAEAVGGCDKVKAMLVQAMLPPSYHDLNDRVQSLESDVRYLDRRLKVLEGRAEREIEEVLVAIRNKYGTPQS